MELTPLWKWLTDRRIVSGEPPPMDDHYYTVEVEVANTLNTIQCALEANPHDRYLETARNHVSDAYLSVIRASALYREQAGKEAG